MTVGVEVGTVVGVGVGVAVGTFVGVGVGSSVGVGVRVGVGMGGSCELMLFRGIAVAIVTKSVELLSESKPFPACPSVPAGRRLVGVDEREALRRRLLLLEGFAAALASLSLLSKAVSIPTVSTRVVPLSLNKIIVLSSVIVLLPLAT